jgi:hypothetical protein
MSRFRGRLNAYWAYFGFALLGIGLAGWQGADYHHKTTGTVVRARVDDCQIDPVNGVDVTCTGTWRVPNGHRPSHGVIEGVGIPDIGRTVDVRVHGGTGYAHAQLAAPAVFFFVGILMALGVVCAAWRNAGRSRSRQTTPAGLPSG